MTNQPLGRFNQKSADGGTGQSGKNVAEDPFAALEKIKEALDRGLLIRPIMTQKKQEL